MATESLVVELSAKTQSLESGIDRTENKLDSLKSKTSETDTGFTKLTKTAGAVATALVKVGAAAIGVGTAISAMVVSSAKGRQELETLATTAKTTVSDFEALSYATNQYQVDAKGTADAMNDVIERLGEFSVGDGAGAFDDFALAMGLSKDEAMDLANELKELTGEQAITELVSQMEEAGTSGADMTFVMKSLSNDLEYMAPLFKDNASELKALKDRYNEVNGALSITQTQAEALKGSAETFDLMTASIGKAGTAISATLAPVFDDFFNDVIQVVPDATQAIVDFINSFLAAEDIQSIAAVNKEIEASEERLLEINEKLNGERVRARPILLNNRDEEEARLEALKEQLVVLEEQTAQLEDAERFSGGRITGEGGEGGDAAAESAKEAIKAAEDAEIESIQNRLQEFEESQLTKIELLNAQYEAEKELIDKRIEDEAAKKETLLELEQEYNDAINELTQSDLESLEEQRDNEIAEYQALLDNKLISTEEFLKKKKSIEESFATKSAKLTTDTEDDKSDAIESGLSAASTINEQFFEDNKAVNAGLIVADTAVAVMSEYKKGGPTAAAAAALEGAVQLAANASSSIGSSSTSSVSSSTSYDYDYDDDDDDDDEVEITSTDTTGDQSITLYIESDDSDVATAISAILNTATVSGTI